MQKITYSLSWIGFVPSLVFAFGKWVGFITISWWWILILILLVYPKKKEERCG